MMRSPLLALILLFLALATVTMRGSLQEFGDGREYVLQTQALVFDRSIAIDPAKRIDYFNRTNPFGVQLAVQPERRPLPAPGTLSERAQYGGNLGALYPAQNGRWYFAHSWVYSAVVAPAYALLHLLTPGKDGGSTEYRAFFLVNLALLAAPLLLLWRARPGWATVAFVACIAVSPVTPHLQWAHPEIFCLSLTLCAFALGDGPYTRFLAPLALGVAAAQNIPLLLFLPALPACSTPLHNALLSPRRDACRQLLRLGARIIPAVGLAAIVPLSNYHLFGTWNIIVALQQASTANITLQRLWSISASPIIGAWWYFPAASLGLIWALALGYWARAAVVCLTVVAVAALSSATSNSNSAQIAACRYAVWYLAPLYWLPFAYPGLPARPSGQRVTAVCALTVGALATVVGWLGTWRLAIADVTPFFSLNRATPAAATLYRLTHFHDDPEVFVENILMRELRTPHDFSGIYIWNLGAGRSLWVVSKRGYQHLGKMIVRPLGDAPSSLAVLHDLFEVQRVSRSRYALIPKTFDTFQHHPVFGGYHYLWVEAEVAATSLTVPVFVRGATDVGTKGEPQPRRGAPAARPGKQASIRQGQRQPHAE